jgi:hypothetical protein
MCAHRTSVRRPWRIAYGLVLDNPSQRLPPHLTWSFNFPFEGVSRNDEVRPLSAGLIADRPVPRVRDRRGHGHAQARSLRPGSGARICRKSLTAAAVIETVAMAVL